MSLTVSLDSNVLFAVTPEDARNWFDNPATRLEIDSDMLDAVLILIVSLENVDGEPEAIIGCVGRRGELW